MVLISVLTSILLFWLLKSAEIRLVCMQERPQRKKGKVIGFKTTDSPFYILRCLNESKYEVFLFFLNSESKAYRKTHKIDIKSKMSLKCYLLWISKQHYCFMINLCILYYIV